jgi:peptide deformylase
MRDIITHVPDLRVVCADVKPEDNPESIANEMLQTLALTAQRMGKLGQHPAGLAAPQIGYSLRMFIMLYGLEVICLVNPRITKTRGRQKVPEGCLSFPGRTVVIERPMIVKMKALNRFMKPVTYKFTGHDAVIASHEYDHLDGKLIIDYIDEEANRGRQDKR